MTQLENGLNLVLNTMRIYWNYFVNDTPLLVKMCFLSGFVGIIVYLIMLVFGGNLSGKQNL